ncbi:GUN4 domain-containing protein [[Leptolyngbya] sp. PCC 7376]|uniref:GUN4 domain-containing protein n=1 Tax=[Leptolyngbya] sp. PCC 7376 TaxID=111781 RepID=UPI0002FEE512|nr:GUN4 domain-containing protein [[Leptolyngbya] sp. PCC 7376]
MKKLQSLILAIAAFSFGRCLFAEPLLAKQADTFYSDLESALMSQDWETANDLTRVWVGSAIFPPNYDPVQIEALTCETLQIIDGMWQQYSGGQFGFSVQGALASPPSQAATHIAWVEQWGDHLGWYQFTPLEKRSAQWQTRESFAWKLSDEINYSTTASQGHLPWVGEDAARIIALSEADKAPCGSCSYEAFYMQSVRYYEYLPALFHRLQTCQLLNE